MKLRRLVAVYAITGVGLGLTVIALAAGWALFMDHPPGGSFPAMVVVSGFVAAASGGIVLSAVVGLQAENGGPTALGCALGFLALGATFTGTFTTGFALGREGPASVGFPGWTIVAALAASSIPAAIVGGTSARLSVPGSTRRGDDP